MAYTPIMSRRSDHSRSEFIELVVTAAEAIVTETGTGQPSARAIARRIGYSPGSLYLAFENIDDIITHVNARTLDRLYASIHAQTNADQPAVERLKQCAHAYAAFAHANPELWRLCFEHTLPPEQTVPALLDTRIKTLVDLVLQPLAEASNQPPEQLTGAAQALWAGVHGICILTLTDKLRLVGTQTTDHLIDDLVTNYLRGVTAQT